MAENNFLNYKGKPLVRSGKEIFYGDMADAYVIKFTVETYTKKQVYQIYYVVGEDYSSVQKLKTQEENQVLFNWHKELGL